MPIQCLPIVIVTSAPLTARTTRLHNLQSRTTSVVHPASPTPPTPCYQADRTREGRPHHGRHLCTNTSPLESEASASMIEEPSVLVLVTYARSSLRQPWPTVTSSCASEPFATTNTCTARHSPAIREGHGCDAASSENGLFGIQINAKQLRSGVGFFDKTVVIHKVHLPLSSSHRVAASMPTTCRVCGRTRGVKIGKITLASFQLAEWVW